MLHLPYRCHLNKDVPLIPKAFTHHKGWQSWVIVKLFRLAHGKQEYISALPFWVGSVTLRAVMGLLAGEKPPWSWWPGEQAVLEGWLVLCIRAWACEMARPYKCRGMGDVEIGFCFPTVLCNPSCLLFSVVLPNCHRFSGNMLASPPSHVSQENAEPNGVRSITGLIACSRVGIQIRGTGGMAAELPLLSATRECHSRACCLSPTGGVAPPVCFPPPFFGFFFSFSFGKGQSRTEGER